MGGRVTRGGSKPIFGGTFRLCYRLYVQCKIDYLEVHIYKMEWKGSSFKMGGKKLMALGTLAWSHKVVGSTIHHGQLIKWTLIARVFVDLFRGLKGLFSLVHV